MTMFYNSAKGRYKVLKQFENAYDDPFFTAYKPHLKALLEIVEQSGDAGEGSVFYVLGNKERTADKLDTEFRDKREGIALFAMSKSRVLEIGFNSGFSSLLMLIANPNLKIVSVDAGYHSYTPACGRYLEKEFGDRFRLVMGDSRELLPILLHNDRDFDGYHIDGGHQEGVAESDLCSIINVAKDGSTICFDDADFPELRRILTLYLLKGSVSHIFDPAHHLPSRNQMFLRVNR